MANIKRRMKRSQKETEITFFISGYCENGELFVEIEADSWGGGSKIADTDFPDGDLPCWFVEKIVNRIEHGPYFGLRDMRIAANRVIQEEPALKVYSWKLMPI